MKMRPRTPRLVIVATKRSGLAVASARAKRSAKLFTSGHVVCGGKRNDDVDALAPREHRKARQAQLCQLLFQMFCRASGFGKCQPLIGVQIETIRSGVSTAATIEPQP